MLDIKQKNLCYNCDQTYTSGHRCKNRTLYMIMSEAEEAEITEQPDPIESTHLIDLSSPPKVSLNTISGFLPSSTFILQGHTQSQLLHILIDTGPTALPPPRSITHSIQLKPTAIPKKFPPYRYPHVQKTEIETIVKELIFSGLIQHSQSPSPFILVFFDDILVYSKTLDQHYTHLSTVLGLLRQHKLYAKPSKCTFGSPHIEYLGHIITVGGVSVDPSKITARVEWSTPKHLKSLRGFLGLTGYYRKFIKGYGTISRPLTDLLKKDSFTWTEAASSAFTALKSAMTTAPVLRLPDFTLPFVIETDASSKGFGANLMHEGRPLD
ncbi:hypothetical protein LIER_44002 [Lithospermum erythrorhizon]|uniref:Uncharacterized protein n=1 Tax=Lithospermum erythrorhizon TaxID=34254 RepID=A0AAV3RLA0_LITER